MNFSIIVAADLNNGIGKNGKIPWHLPTDLKYFSKITRGSGKNAVIMGRTTWESLPSAHRPLKDRINIVLTRNADLELPINVEKAQSLDKALEIAEKHTTDEIFVIGGAQVYAETINHPNCEKIYLTRVFKKFDCDAFFSKINESIFKKNSSSGIQKENGISFEFRIYSK